jgi:hypothetical protein
MQGLRTSERGSEAVIQGAASFGAVQGQRHSVRGPHSMMPVSD